MEQWIARALELGFSAAVPLRTDTLQPRADVRAMCSADTCRAYGKNWTCPPHCGTVQECQEKMHSYQNGILLQTTGRMTKAIDSKCYRETERRHLENFYALADKVREVYPKALCLGAGGCRVCGVCAKRTGEPCRHPDLAMSSLEAYGINVSRLAPTADMKYINGNNTVTYFGAVLFSVGEGQ